MGWGGKGSQEVKGRFLWVKFFSFSYQCISVKGVGWGWVGRGWDGRWDWEAREHFLWVLCFFSLGIIIRNINIIRNIIIIIITLEIKALESYMIYKCASCYCWGFICKL